MPTPDNENEDGPAEVVHSTECTTCGDVLEADGTCGNTSCPDSPAFEGDEEDDEEDFEDDEDEDE